MVSGTELIHGEDGTRSISDINVTPFIDVMLVLLIIFMVTAPLMMGGVKINLPKTASAPMPRPDHPLIISLDVNSQVFVEKDMVDEALRLETFRRLAVESETGEVFVKGDGDVKYSKMMDLMSELGQAGFARVTLVTNVQPGGPTPSAGESAPTAPAASAAPVTPAGEAASPAANSAPAAPQTEEAASPAPAGQ
jgi:biopolymer transport protein ExbD